MVCYLSFLLFTGTSLYASLESKAGALLPGFELKTVVFAILTIAVLFAGVSGGERSARFVYSLSFFFFLPTALSFSQIDWSAVFGFPTPTSLQPLLPALLMGLLIIGGYMLFLSTSWLDRTHAELTRRGGARPEVDTAVSGQLTLSIAVVSASVLVGLVAALLCGLPELETTLAGFPSAYAILGLGGGLLVILCTSLYLVAVRGERAKAPELEFEILGPKPGKRGKRTPHAATYMKH